LVELLPDPGGGDRGSSGWFVALLRRFPHAVTPHAYRAGSTGGLLHPTTCPFLHTRAPSAILVAHFTATPHTHTRAHLPPYAATAHHTTTHTGLHGLLPRRTHTHCLCHDVHRRTRWATRHYHTRRRRVFPAPTLHTPPLRFAASTHRLRYTHHRRDACVPHYTYAHHWVHAHCIPLPHARIPHTRHAATAPHHPARSCPAAVLLPRAAYSCLVHARTAHHLPRYAATTTATPLHALHTRDGSDYAAVCGLRLGRTHCCTPRTHLTLHGLPRAIAPRAPTHMDQLVGIPTFPGSPTTPHTNNCCILPSCAIEPRPTFTFRTGGSPSPGTPVTGQTPPPAQPPQPIQLHPGAGQATD